MPGLILVAAGFFTFFSAVLDWEFFMNTEKVRFITAIFYALMGLAFVIFGTMMPNFR